MIDGSSDMAMPLGCRKYQEVLFGNGEDPWISMDLYTWIFFG